MTYILALLRVGSAQYRWTAACPMPIVEKVPTIVPKMVDQNDSLEPYGFTSKL